MLLALAAGCAGEPGGPMTPTAPAPVAPPAPAAPQPVPEPEGPSTARYRVVFDSTWTAATHPQDAPDNPHFSPPIGATHNASVAFWRDGALASEGIRLMAESGRTSPLDTEIRAAIAAGTAQNLFIGVGFSSPKTIELEFEVSRDFPLVTLVTMVAPSPDWFAGVSGLPLYENGAWIQERVVQVLPWDAGTDSGASFMSNDLPTVPRQPISRIATAPFAAGGVVTPLGTFRFTKLP
jgi:Spondin_N